MPKPLIKLFSLVTLLTVAFEFGQGALYLQRVFPAMASHAACGCGGTACCCKMKAQDGGGVCAASRAAAANAQQCKHRPLVPGPAWVTCAGQAHLITLSGLKHVLLAPDLLPGLETLRFAEFNPAPKLFKSLEVGGSVYRPPRS